MPDVEIGSERFADEGPGTEASGMTKTRFLVLALCLCALAASVASAQRTRAARILPLATSQWTADDRGILGAMERGDQTIDVFKTCLRHTELCRNWMPFTRYILSARSTLPPRDRELLILRASALSHADYDWGHHVPAAQRAGLSDDEIARIAKGPEAGWNAFDAALLRAADELHRDQFITDATWAELAKTYNERQLMDAIFTVGQYTMVSMFLNSAGVQREPGVVGVPK
jgi:4-carboxymuconolactone decarboxylase